MFDGEDGGPLLLDAGLAALPCGLVLDPAGLHLVGEDFLTVLLGLGLVAVAPIVREPVEVGKGGASGTDMWSIRTRLFLKTLPFDFW